MPVVMFVYMMVFKWMEIDFKDAFYVILLQISFIKVFYKTRLDEYYSIYVKQKLT